MCNKLDEPYTQVLSNNFDEALKQYFRGYDSRKSTSEPTSLGDIYVSTIILFLCKVTLMVLENKDNFS